MEINRAEFITSAAELTQYALAASGTDLPEICVVGRSNVGKSSFINTLCRRKSLAKTSSTPGRTRLINLFLIEERFVLVDLPGYGYAKASKQAQEQWSGLIEAYLSTTKKLKHVLLLVDSRHTPSAQDIQMMQYLYFCYIPFTVLATKTDKLSKAQIGRAVQNIATALGLGCDNVIAVSENGTGRDRVLNLIEHALETGQT